MSYRVRFTTQTGATGYWDGTFATRAGATMSAQSRADITGYTYTVEEWPDVSTVAKPDATPDPTASQQGPAQPVPSKPHIGIMPRRVWKEQRIRALAEAIVRRMGNGAPTVASVFDFDHVHDWAAEIVELCEWDVTPTGAANPDAARLNALQAFIRAGGAIGRGHWKDSDHVASWVEADGSTKSHTSLRAAADALANKAKP